MPAKRHKLENAVRTVIAENPTWGPERIFAHMYQEAIRNRLSPEHLPSTSTIARIKQRFRDSEHAPYRLARWPESFGDSGLPWEAGAAVAELTRAIGRPPLVRLARWYWRVRQAEPHAAVDFCRAWATEFAVLEDNPARLREAGAAFMSRADFTIGDYDLSMEVAELTRGYALVGEERDQIGRNIELVRLIRETKQEADNE